MCKLGLKTIVIVHKDFLLQQWKERIEEFAPSAKIGMIKAKVIDVENKDIVIASLQSLSMKTYSNEVFQGFGFIVVDECHHTSAEVFCQALQKVTCKYSLGLSATINRKDGLGKVFQWYLGKVVFSNCKQKSNDVVDIYWKEFYDPNPVYGREEYMMRDKLNVSKMINNICEFYPRIEFIANIIKDIVSSEPNRKVLVLSDRKLQLELFMGKLTKMGLTCGYYTGGMKTEELKESETKQVLLGTYAMVAEGFDVKTLDTLVLASPKSDVVQSVGRILREVPEKRTHVPIVVDIVDKFSLFERQAEKRAKFYKSKQYNLKGDYTTDKRNPRTLVTLDTHAFIDLE
jgi:superfamily II DNA or RNA helicase